MTDPTDEPQPRPTGDANGAGAGAGAAAGAGGAGAATGVGAGEATPGQRTDPARPAAAEDVASRPPLRADPDRPADSGWREPPWIPPRGRGRQRGPSAVAIVVGLVLIAAGLYAFADQTLGIALPTIEWSTVWPLILVAVGGWILIRSVQRGS